MLKYSNTDIRKFLLANGYVIEEITPSNSANKDDVIVCAIKKELFNDGYKLLPYSVLWKYNFRDIFEQVFNHKLFNLVLNSLDIDKTIVNS